MKAAGVVIDDAAVTPTYVLGLSPSRELPIIWRIGLGSLRNKLIFLLPMCLVLSALAQWLITPMLMLGGAYLCFEGAEKLHEAFASSRDRNEVSAIRLEPDALEEQKVREAIRTDFILSAEIMALTMAGVSKSAVIIQAAALAAVGILITVAVYGVVALIVKADDIGLHLAKHGPGFVRSSGRGLVKGVPLLLNTLAAAGTAAMLWVGGNIVVHGFAVFGFQQAEHAIEHSARTAETLMPGAHTIVDWLVTAFLQGIGGLVVGIIVILLVTGIRPLVREWRTARQ